MNLPRTYEKLYCIGEPYRFSGQRDPSVQTSCYFIKRITRIITNHGSIFTVPTKHPGSVSVSVVGQDHVLLQLKLEKYYKNRFKSRYNILIDMLWTRNICKSIRPCRARFPAPSITKSNPNLFDLKKNTTTHKPPPIFNSNYFIIWRLGGILSSTVTFRKTPTVSTSQNKSYFSFF